MRKRTMTYADWQAPEQRKALVASERRNRANSALSDILVFWRFCGQPVCRRRHACSGDPDACFARQWALCSEDAKVGIRAFMDARAAGLSDQRAFDAADAKSADVESARRFTNP